MKLTEIKQALKTLEKDKLIDLITDLYKKNKPVQEYLDFFVNPDVQALYEKYKEKVLEALYPKRGFGLKLIDGKRAISDFKKHNPPLELIADMTLFYVELGVKFTKEFGDIDEAFYSSIETTFNTVLKLARKENLLPKFEARAGKILTDSDGMGWGFHDTLCNIHCEYYED